MALSWTMDKLGPICRTVEDCALVLEAIYGPDGRDPTVADVPFVWDASVPLSNLRIGFVKSAFEDTEARTHPFDTPSPDVLRRLGADLIPIELPSDLPISAMRIILTAEAGAAFDDLTRSNRDDFLVRQNRGAWPTTFRRSRLIPAVEYIQANRVRTMLMGQMEAAMAGIDVFITPSYANNVLLITNLTGHPAISLPNGFQEDGSPVSISFIGRLFAEDRLLVAAKAYQDATDFHTKHPPAFS